MKFKKIIAATLASVCILTGFLQTAPVLADQVEAPYLSLGADLNASEKATVLDLLDVDADQLDNYIVVTVTNQEEHDYLGAYLDDSLIGTRALSSVVVERRPKGEGISVKTNNITYCTTGMYQNALVTAGLKNAEIRVAGPFAITGTAALVGAMKAYSAMTGESIQPENATAATEELITTSELGEAIGDQTQAENLIGAVKDIIVSEEITSPEKIQAVIEDTAEDLKISLTQEDLEKIKGLMKKISSLDLDVQALKEQAKDLYERLENLNLNLNIDKEEVKGFLDTILSWFQKALEQIREWLAN